MPNIIQPLSSRTWEIVNLPAARIEAPIAISLSLGIGLTEAVMPTSGEVFGYAIALDAPATAGNLFVRGQINGVALTTQFDAGVALLASSSFFRVLDANRFFQAGQTLEVLVEDIGLAPITLDLSVAIHVILNRGVSTDEGI